MTESPTNLVAALDGEKPTIPADALTAAGVLVGVMNGGMVGVGAGMPVDTGVRVGNGVGVAAAIGAGVIVGVGVVVGACAGVGTGALDDAGVTVACGTLVCVGDGMAALVGVGLCDTTEGVAVRVTVPVVKGAGVTVGVGMGVTVGVGVVVGLGTSDADSVGVDVITARAVTVGVGDVSAGRAAPEGSGGIGVTVALTSGVGDAASRMSGVAVCTPVTLTPPGWGVGDSVAEATVSAAGSAVLIEDTDGIPEDEAGTGTTVVTVKTVGEAKGSGVVVAMDSNAGPSTEMSHATAANEKRTAKTPSNAICFDIMEKLCRV